jgi:hypothetical protein
MNSGGVLALHTYVVAVYARCAEFIYTICSNNRVPTFGRYLDKAYSSVPGGVDSKIECVRRVLRLITGEKALPIDFLSLDCGRIVEFGSCADARNETI